ncbi:EAL domain-containing protein [Chitinimonas sp. BJB300]|uniref:EAL domain-containing protein n=1 Tax=Chitinimonas sp. BJB300 TaxID=1559339 RepID=UPI0018ED9150|nr:EAL domain-containing protein [Chitinimonas sp. BJB300]
MFSSIFDRQIHVHPTHLASTLLLDLMRQQRYGVEYQPIVELKSQEIMGHEALARFYSADCQPLAPKMVFNALHRSPLSLYQVEFDIKRLQLENAPGSGTLFVNLDPDAYAVTADEADEPLLTLLSHHNSMVVEIIEDTDVSDAHLSQQLVRALAARGICLALDDIGAPNSVISLDVMMKVDWFKFDRSWLARAHNSRARAALLHLIAFAHECGGKVILEGVEHEHDLALARALGVDCVQGFLYRDHFISIAKTQPRMRTA